MVSSVLLFCSSILWQVHLTRQSFIALEIALGQQESRNNSGRNSPERSLNPHRSSHIEHIYYPMRYLGSFESSDPLLNRIWETGAYTVHLCMQDDIWDAPKRDRGRWMGDTDISGRVSDYIFLDRFLIRDTLRRLVGRSPVEEHVNGIPSYSSFWFTALQDYERHTGDREFLRQMHPQLLQLLRLMDTEFDAQNRFINRTHEWLFVDWALDLNGDTPETRSGTTVEYYRAYLAGSDLLRQLGDRANAEHFESRADFKCCIGPSEPPCRSTAP